MNWKKLLLIAAAIGAFALASAPKSDAGVRVGIGIGFPVAYPAYGYPYYPYYPYGYAYPYGYPYGYAPYYGSFGFGPVVHSGRVVVVRDGHHVHHHHPH